MKKILFLLTLLLIIKCTFSQIPIGQKYDINGTPLNGYIDPLVYAPDKKISYTHYSDSYEQGYYYDRMGKRNVGLIKYQNKKIFFKKDDFDYKLKITPEEIDHLVIGIDSFFVITDFYYKNRIKDKPEFVQYITEFNGYTFVKHYHFASELGKEYGMQAPILETYLVKANDSTVWDNFPNNRHFKKRALKYFQHIPYLKDKISSGAYKFKDILSIIKMAEYYEKYNNSETIYFDKYWQELRNVDKAKYSAKITNKTDSIWTFEYFDNEKNKLFEANYSSFYPNIKEGYFTSYHPNDSIRQIALYQKNKPKEVRTFNKQGDLKTHYQYIKRKNEYSEPATVIIYLTINDSLGNNIIRDEDKSTLESYNISDGHTYTSIFKNAELSTYYRLMNKDTVFQIISSEYKLKIKSLHDKFNNYMANKNYDGALNVNAQGVTLVSLIVNSKGYTIDAKILNPTHPALDSLINDFLETRFLGGLKHRFIRFKKFKNKKVNRYFELVIPIEFNINRFYRQPVNYFYYNHFDHFNMHNSIHTIPPPSFTMPSGF